MRAALRDQPGQLQQAHAVANLLPDQAPHQRPVVHPAPDVISHSWAVGLAVHWHVDADLEQAGHSMSKNSYGQYLLGLLSER